MRAIFVFLFIGLTLSAFAQPPADFDGLWILQQPALRAPLALARSLEFHARRSVSRSSVPIVVDATCAQTIFEDDFLAAIAPADFIFIGERHDDHRHHEIQAELLKKLVSSNPNLVLGLEMVDITHQETLDRFSAGAMSEEEFARFWKNVWGFDYDLYRPIFEVVRRHRMMMRGLNAPIAIARKVAKSGLSSLTPNERGLLPSQINPIENASYLAYLKKAIAEHWPGPVDPAKEALLIEAQMVWNETMAETLVGIRVQGRQALVIAGMGHMFYKAGILESVEKRVRFSQRYIQPYPLDSEDVRSPD